MRQRQDWKGPQTEDLKLVIQENYTFIACNSFFIALGILGNSLKEINIEKSFTFSCTNETFLYTSSFSTSLSLLYKQFNRVKNEVDGQPKSLLAYVKVSAGKAAFNLCHLVSLHLDTDFWHLDCKPFYEKLNVIIPKIFYF